MVKNYNKNLSKFYLFLIRIIFFYNIKSSRSNECPYEKPILLKNEKCELYYCTKENFASNYCSINNTIVKTQWINNIIKIGGLTYRYINFASYSNKDMVIETTCYEGEPKRYFYGLKANGRPLFKDKQTNKETPYYMIETNEEKHPHKGKYESEAIVIKSSEENENNGKEYFLSVSKLECYAEIFDFENDKIYYKPITKFNPPFKSIKTFRHSFFPFKSTNNKYYYFFGFIGDDSYDEDKNLTINLQKHIFNSVSEFSEKKSTTGKIQTILKGYGRIVSGFQTSSGLIITFYLIKPDNIYFNIRKYETDFTDPIDYKFESNVNFLENYYKCIFLKGEIGVFSYFKYDNQIIYPFLMFKEFDIKNNSFKDFLPSKYTNSQIRLDRRQFFGAVLINDIIRLNENKICFSTVVTDKETIYIILVNVFGQNEIKVRYYSIFGYELYHFKILYELRIHNYNNFVAFASSYCPNQKCDENTDEHYSSLIIFSYPNSTDIEFDLENYLYENNDKNINDIEIYIKENLVMQNNIFGYIVESYFIENISNCGEYKISLDSNETIEIRRGAIINTTEKLMFKFIGIGKNYPPVNCLIQYYFIATEPDLKDYDEYPEYKEGDDDNINNYFQKNEYFGRLTDYVVKLNRDLTTDCAENCNLCVKNEEDYCITCQYNFSPIEENGKTYKKCLDNPIIEPEIITTNLIIDETTEVMTTNLLIDETTEAMTDNNIITTNLIIDETTETMTDKNIITTNLLIDETTKTMTDKDLITTNLIIDEATEALTHKNIIATNLIIDETTEALTDKNIITTNLIKDETTEIMTNRITIINKITDEITEQETIKSDIAEKTEKIDKTCANEVIIQNQCKNGFVTENQIADLNDDIKKEYLTEGYNGQNNIIKTENVLFQITKLDNQTKFNESISKIDLGECEKLLKESNDIPESESLIIFKTDVKTKDLTHTFVQYEIYNPIDLERLNLSICENNKITISTKLNLDSSTLSLYNSLKTSGYDLLNQNDSFFHDICTRYTSPSGTDVTLNDRNSGIFTSMRNLSLCQTGCELIFFDSITQDIKCNCNPQLKDIESIFSFSDKKFIIEMFKDSIFTSIKSSNFLVLSCYKIALDTNDLLSNVGRILMTIIFVISFIFFIYFFLEYKKIGTYILSILNYTMNNNFNNLKKEEGNQISKNENFKVNKKKIAKSNSTKIKKGFHKTYKNSSHNVNIYKNKSLKTSIYKNKIKAIKRKKYEPPKRNQTFNIDNNSKKNNHYNSIENSMNSKNYFNEGLLKQKRHNTKDTKKLNTSTNFNANTNINIIKIKNYHIKKLVKSNKNVSKSRKNNSFKKSKFEKEVLQNKIHNLNNGINADYLIDEELNLLEYNLALELDKRSFCQYYFSLIKKKQLIFFAFFSGKDYNLFSIKLSLLLTNFSLYLTVNCFFFNDKTMHKLYINEGAYGLIYRLPQIFYTFIISSVVNIILRQLSLSQKVLIELKQEKLPYITKKAQKIKKCLIIKFTLFFILNTLLLCFFWYFISCFCGVFRNTQIILIGDCLISFGLTLFYPFFYNLIPGIFRISSLRATEKNKECMYLTGRVFALI